MESRDRQADLDEFSRQVASVRDTIESFGWEIVEAEDAVTVHRRFKNGKLRKGADAHFTYSDTEYAYSDFNDEGEFVEVFQPSQRPWSVSGASLTRASTFKSVEKAARKFLDVCHDDAKLFGLMD